MGRNAGQASRMAVQVPATGLAHGSTVGRSVAIEKRAGFPLALGWNSCDNRGLRGGFAPGVRPMSTPLLYNVLFAWKCSSTHHKLALDALRHLRGPDCERWRDLFLGNIEPYLTGSKSPDNQFKDFKNHVLHVEDDFWGGAIGAAQQWYEKTKAALAAKRWTEAVYNAGVLSHYYSDPWQPYHTGQTEQEGIVHRAAEWSIACAYQELMDLLEQDLGGYPDVPMPAGPDWLGDMIRQAATTAHRHYQATIDHYDIKLGTKNPPAGMDQEFRQRIAPLLGSAVVGYARILDRVIAEAAVTPPSTNVTVLGALAQLTVPIFFVTKKMKDAKERSTVLAMYQEFQATGKVLKTLPEDDRIIRQLHAEEVTKTPLEKLDAEIPLPPGKAFQGPAQSVAPMPAPKAQPTAAVVTPVKRPEMETHTAYTAKSSRCYLHRVDPVEKAPSIGPKTAALLERIGIKTVADLLDQSPDVVAKKLNQRHLDAAEIAAWQCQARLMCEVAGLRGHDAQLLVACRITARPELAAAQPERLHQSVTAFAKSSAGERILRNSAAPDRAEVDGWIAAAQTPVATGAAA